MYVQYSLLYIDRGTAAKFFPTVYISEKQQYPLYNIILYVGVSHARSIVYKREIQTPGDKWYFKMMFSTASVMFLNRRGVDPTIMRGTINIYYIELYRIYSIYMSVLDIYHDYNGFL